MAKRNPPKENTPRAANPGEPNHDEWLLDESVEESFPASDPATPARPGSTLAKRYQTNRKTAKAKAGNSGKRRG